MSARFRVARLGFGKAPAMMKKLRKTVEAATADVYFEDFAQQTYTYLTENIRAQRFKLAPLSAKYLREKIRRGYDQRILIRTGSYLESIEKVRFRGTWGVRLRPGARTKERVDMQDIATWLEYGTKTMPARPHWRVTELWAKDTFDRNWYDRIQSFIRTLPNGEL